MLNKGDGKTADGQEAVAIICGSFKNTTITEILSVDPCTFDKSTRRCVT